MEVKKINTSKTSYTLIRKQTELQVLQVSNAKKERERERRVNVVAGTPNFWLMVPAYVRW
jgi:hypothetical protein